MCLPMPMPVKLTPAMIIQNPDFYSLYPSTFAKLEADWIKEKFIVNINLQLCEIYETYVQFDWSNKGFKEKGLFGDYFYDLLKPEEDRVSFEAYLQVDYSNNLWFLEIKLSIKKRWGIQAWIESYKGLNTLKKNGYKTVNTKEIKKIRYNSTLSDTFIVINLRKEISIWGMPLPNTS
jgi:hypothetical protein